MSRLIRPPSSVPIVEMEVVGRGRCADIFGDSPDSVLKVYQPRFHHEWVVEAAEQSAAIYNAGVPSPAVLEVVRLDGISAIRFERVPGETLWDSIVERPERSHWFGARLADLAVETHRVQPSGLSNRLDIVAERVARHSERHPGAVEQAIHQLIQARDYPVVLTHGDLHPANVMTSGDRLIGIDWDGAALGPAGYDLARADYLVRNWAVAPGTNPAVEPFREAVADGFVARLDELGVRSTMDEWRLAVVLARYSEDIPEEHAMLDAEAARLVA